ncbi:MAG: tRNA pseudouridine(38-40) synthase TruA [Lactobacillaceae bacterium]|jgi:tRNA pseudouridine38-40 synthase|nr:tRNA pseudouridine(38-40) synthase TruA [Lactobacillaceae bacterium]
MQNYKITMAYDGHGFEGFQIQNRVGSRTVGGELNKAVNLLAQKANLTQAIKVIGASRTDSGVHANGQVANFFFPYDMPATKMTIALNSVLPDDILIVETKKVNNDFHSRHSGHSKRYYYRVSLDKYQNPFKRFYTAHYYWPLDFQLIQESIVDFLGEHDFASFAAAGDQSLTTIRTITKAEMKIDQLNNELIFIFEGNAFLYNQIRIMVGVLLEIGNRKRAPHDILRLFEVKDRQQARFTAPASGLYLDKVFYDE